MAKRRNKTGETQPPSEQAITVHSPDFGKITPPEGTIESLPYAQLLDALLLPTVHPLEMGLYQAWKGVVMREYAVSRQEKKG